VGTREERVSVSEADFDALRQMLNKRLSELRQSIESTADNRKTVEVDPTSTGRLSRMDALQNQAMAQAAERLRTQEIERIKAALRRIDEHEFGYCVACGEPIGHSRLATDPTVPTCIRCASGSAR
jgi:DnaK suppressor protein